MRATRKRSDRSKRQSRKQNQKGGYCVPIATVKDIVQKEFRYTPEELQFNDLMRNGSELSRFEPPLNPQCLTYNEVFALMEHYLYWTEPLHYGNVEDDLTKRLKKHGIHDPHDPVVLAGRMQNLKDSRRLALPADLKALTASYLTGKKGSLNSQYNQLMQNRGVTLAPRMGGRRTRVARGRTTRRR